MAEPVVRARFLLPEPSRSESVRSHRPHTFENSGATLGTPIFRHAVAAVTLLCPLLFLTACGSASETITRPSQPKCQVQAASERVTFTPDGGREQFGSRRRGSAPGPPGAMCRGCHWRRPPADRARGRSSSPSPRMPTRCPVRATSWSRISACRCRRKAGGASSGSPLQVNRSMPPAASERSRSRPAARSAAGRRRRMFHGLRSRRPESTAVPARSLSEWSR